MPIIPRTFAFVFSFSVKAGILFLLLISHNSLAREDFRDLGLPDSPRMSTIAAPANKESTAIPVQNALPASVSTSPAPNNSANSAVTVPVIPPSTASMSAPTTAPVPTAKPAEKKNTDKTAQKQPQKTPQEIKKQNKQTNNSLAHEKTTAEKLNKVAEKNSIKNSTIQNHMSLPESAVTLDLPPVEKIAEELGYKPQEFKKFVDDFSSSLTGGPKSAAYHRLCARDEETCVLIKDFHNQEWSAKANRRRSRQKVKRFRITEDNVSQAQRFDFRVLVGSLKTEDESKLYQLAELSLKETQCPRNLSSALSVKAEEYFPIPRARQVSRELFEHARHCIQQEDFAYERLFLRQALYAYYEGDKQKAREYLVAAKEAKNNTERYRVLYWLGRLAHEDGVRGSDNQDWKELMNEFPLSFYAIQAAVTLKQDPLEMITQRKLGGLKREATDDPELNRMIRWLEALYLYKNVNAVGKWASWIVRSNEDNLDVGVLHYLSTLKIASGMYRSNITMLFSYFRKNPSALNNESLKLLYPRPYFSMIDDASKGKIDTFLVLGLVRQESAFDPRAVSHARAKGLMQIIPQTARRLASQGHRKLLDEKENTKMGVKYLLQLSEKFNGSVELVLAAYNAGPNKVEDWLRRNPDREKDLLLWNDLIPYMETRDYVVSILRNNYLYIRLYGDKKSLDDKVFSSALVRQLVTQN